MLNDFGVGYINQKFKKPFFDVEKTFGLLDTQNNFFDETHKFGKVEFIKCLFSKEEIQ